MATPKLKSKRPKTGLPTALRADSALPSGYAAFLEDLKTRIRTAQVKAALSVNRELIALYWDIGNSIVDRQHSEGWGNAVIDRLAADLQTNFPGIAGLSRTNIYRMRTFFLAYTQAAGIVPQAVGQIDRSNLAQAVRETRHGPARAQAVREAAGAFLPQPESDMNRTNLPLPVAAIPCGHLQDVLNIQQELLAYCNQIQPTYIPILSIEQYEGRNLIVLWSPGGQNRPYKGPLAVTAKTKDYRYYIRRYSSTIEVRSNSEEVRVNPDGIEIVSYPGPDASIRTEALNGDKIVARRYRNRRIGEFLKELDLTEGRCTGIPTMREAMAENGSPPPRFSTDGGRTYFLAELPVHPKMPGVGQVHDEVHEKAHDEAHHGAHDAAHDELTETEARILTFVENQPKNRPEIAGHLRLKSRSGHLYKAIYHLRNLGFLELTIPEKPQSRSQKMRITEKGRTWLAGRGEPKEERRQ